MFWKDVFRSGRHTHAKYGMRRAICGFWRNFSERIGVLRHNAGGWEFAALHYIPSNPAFGLDQVHVNVWTFFDSIDTLTDAVNANSHKWDESAAGGGTPLAPADMSGGAGAFTNGAADNNYYFYEGDAETILLEAGRDAWFTAIMRVDDATQSDWFMGLCARLGAGNLFDNRVNCVGFKSDDGDANIDIVTTAAGVENVATQTTQETLDDDTNVKLEFHYVAYLDRIFFFVDEVEVATAILTIPATELAVSFGLRNGEAVAKTMTVQRIVAAVDEATI